MGVRIGQTPATIVRLDTTFARKHARAGEGQLLQQSREKLAAQEADSFRAGFGKNTLSPQGAALETVSTGLERARELVPTVEDLQAEAQEAAQAASTPQQGDEAETTAASTQTTGQAPTPPTVTARPKAEPFARFFSNGNAANGASGAGTSGATAAASTPSNVRTQDFRQNAQAPSAPVHPDGSAALLDLIA